MPVPRHLDEAVTRLNEARTRIDSARERPLSLESMQEWLGALTDFALAQSEIQMYNNESVHEKLHEIAGRVRLPEFPPAGPKTRPRATRKS